MKYNHKKIDKKWQDRWQNNDLYHPKNDAKNPFYNLFMFPYPSAEGVHMGTIFSSTGSDIYGRYQRMNQKSVLQPMGYDSFGIHSENYAIKVGETPQKMLDRTIAHFENQFKSIGHGYDWKRKVTTSDIDYYKWTQWIFVQMFKSGLAFRKSATVNWCPSCKTVLADEQVIGQECERCGTTVELKNLNQWFFKITDYADRLLDNLKKIDWSERVVKAQKNWIGKKDGINITYDIIHTNFKLTCWTSRPDTNFGATFIVVSPEHPLAQELATKENHQKVSKYIKLSLKKPKEIRIQKGREKSGVFTGNYALNKLTNRKMPIYIADFVLGDVGTGAVVGVPGHDMRDFEFAQKFNLPVEIVVTKKSDPVRSYLMGANSISDSELNKLNIKITKADSDSRKLEIPLHSLNKYKELIKNKLSAGFWNEVVGEQVWFLFKDKNNKVNEYILNKSNINIIAQKCSEFNDDPVEKIQNIWLYIASNDWYTPLIIQENQGKMINSDFLNGMDINKAITKMMDYLESKGWGKRQTSYHLRDWIISRQRYWGAPIPMIYCEVCASKGKSWFTSKDAQKKPGEAIQFKNWMSSVNKLAHQMPGWYPEENLPVALPVISDYKPKGEGKGPLADHPDFYKTTCPYCGEPAKRETDVCDTFLDSSWYFLAYPNVNSKEYKKDPKLEFHHSISKSASPFNKKLSKHWLPVDLYFGGAEHSVLHLMYSRFVNQVFYDLGYINDEEPFPKFFAHGLMIKDGAKMSKSRGNIVNPDEYIEKYGADTLRFYLVFMGPMDGTPDFRDTGIEGMKRFTERLWILFNKANESYKLNKSDTVLIHQTIKKVTEDIKRYHYNTAVSAIMILVNQLSNLKNNTKENEPQMSWSEALSILCRLIAPFAPHMAEEVWVNLLAKKYSVHTSDWPTYDKNIIKQQRLELPIQVNGKLRGTIEIDISDADDKEKIINIAKSHPKVSKYIKLPIKETIYINNKLINFVI
jgi:leucyl-tRNA synthetase